MTRHSGKTRYSGEGSGGHRELSPRVIDDILSRNGEAGDIYHRRVLRMPTSISVSDRSVLEAAELRPQGFREKIAAQVVSLWGRTYTPTRSDAFWRTIGSQGEHVQRRKHLVDSSGVEKTFVYCALIGAATQAWYRTEESGPFDPRVSQGLRLARELIVGQLEPETSGGVFESLNQPVPEGLAIVRKDDRSFNGYNGHSSIVYHSLPTRLPGYSEDVTRRYLDVISARSDVQGVEYRFGIAPADVEIHNLPAELRAV